MGIDENTVQDQLREDEKPLSAHGKQRAASDRTFESQLLLIKELSGSKSTYQLTPRGWNAMTFY